MAGTEYVIRPISAAEWLPDRCLGGGEPFDPRASEPQPGCSSLDWFYTHGSRKKLEALYREALQEYGGCGFVTWEGEKVVAYHNFFPREMARRIKFYGWGADGDVHPQTLVHNCLTMVRNRYFRKGICSALVRRSLQWATEQGWKRFEVHLVLPDFEKGWQGEQKTCRTFWEKLGFRVYRSQDADEETRRIFGVDERYSMFLTLNHCAIRSLQNV